MGFDFAADESYDEENYVNGIMDAGRYDGEVYMVLGFKCYHDDTRMLYEEFREMFPTDSVVTYEDYKKYENEFLYFNYDFTLTHNNKVVVS